MTDQLGGGYNLLPTRMRIDFRGATAWVGIGDNRVNAMSVFLLRHPVLRQGRDILIAQEDVTLFFERSFRVHVLPYEREDVMRSIRIRRGLQLGNDGLGRRDALSPPTTRVLKRAARPVRVLVIDPGHGGYEPGVTGQGGYTEKDLTLAVGSALKEILERAVSQKIMLTRTEDIYLSLQQRAALANNGEGDFLLSLHAGGSFSAATNGAAIFYPTLPSTATSRRTGFTPQTLALETLAAAESVGAAFREVTASSLRGIHQAPCRLLSAVAMPGFLLEVGCLTNRTEEALLRTETYQRKIAEGIAKGLIPYLEEHMPQPLDIGLNEPLVE